jgi:hypothetical protein
MKTGTILGIAGDALNLAGAIVLILNEIGREKDYRDAAAAAKVLAKLPDIHFETHDGNRLANFADLVLQILRKEKKRALVGLAVLSLGFVFQLLSRLYE